MNEDIVPGLLANIEDDFKKSFQSDDTLKTLYGKVQDGTATQADGEKFSHELGRLTAEVFHRNVTPEILPDGTLYYNIANRIITPILGNNHDIVCEVMKQVIERMNHDAGLGIKFQEPEFESGRVHDLVWKASLDRYEKLRKMVETGLDTFTRSVADDCVRTNAEFQYEAGLSPRIERDTDGDCCSWCSDMAGTYDYKSAPKEVFARHANCGCTVEFLPGDGRRQNVHTKDWTSETESAMMKVTAGIDEAESRSAADRIKALTAKASILPKRFRSYVPSPEDRERMIQRGISEDKPVFAPDVLGVLGRLIPKFDEYYNVITHGNAYGFDFFGEKMDVETFCAIIAQREDYKKGTPIRLIVCNSGAKPDGVAQYVANKLGVEVLAPTEYAQVELNGRQIRIFSADKDGHPSGDFVPFIPRRREGNDYG